MYVFTSHNLLSRNYVSIATRTNSHRAARLDDVPKTQTAALLIERDATRLDRIHLQSCAIVFELSMRQNNTYLDGCSRTASNTSNGSTPGHIAPACKQGTRFAPNWTKTPISGD